MIFLTKNIQGIVDIMSELERINEKIAAQFYILYGEEYGIDDHILFAAAQMQVCEAIDSVGELLASVVTEKE